jgi:Tc toxin complex TcA C-terminal TcB-binding domain
MTEEITAFHYAPERSLVLDRSSVGAALDRLQYRFDNFFHPFVGEFLKQLNENSIAGLLDPNFVQGLKRSFEDEYTIVPDVNLTKPDNRIDLSLSGPYANYNWELLYHIPVMVAVHLSNNQRFAEAQKWFHYVFDPTCTDTNDPAPQRFWRFLAFRDPEQGGGDLPPYSDIQNINTLLRLLSTPEAEPSDREKSERRAVLLGYQAMLENPFQPHVIARTRPGAYQWYVVMKYLDNLIAWGDSLFLQNTIETINEATLCYVLAANILGPRPQTVPQRGVSSSKNFLQLKQAGLDKMGNALVDLEGQFPFNLAPGGGGSNGAGDQSGALFGIGRTLYFCIPPNQTLLAYWDIVADRLFKIRNSENIQGVVQQLPLFDQPLDPGMLVKAVAAGIDISSIVSGLNQALGPVRSPLLIQKALEIAAEVRSLGNALLVSFEKGDAEQLALRRQGHEVQLQQMVQNVRYLQWQHAKELTNALLKTRGSALERYTYYLRLLGVTPDANAVPRDFDPDRRELNEDNFDAAYSTLVGEYDRPVPLQDYTRSQIVGASSPSNQSGSTGSGQLYLNTNEDLELNMLLPRARGQHLDSGDLESEGAALAIIPDFFANADFLGLGPSLKVFGGSVLSDVIKLQASVTRTMATFNQDQAGIAFRTATYQRRADEWIFQANLAARELMQIGRQIISSLIAEQIAYHDYQNVKTQVQQALDIQAFLETKFTNTQFYDWQTSEITRLYYQYYRFACDIARKAEQTMKRELMRPELDGTQFIQFNYWDNGHNGLLSGEKLVLDIKRMEMAYHDNNRRELELTRHVSLRQLDPLALLTLKIAGSCTVSVPEWLYDLDCPGLYMRRIKSVAVSVPCVVGPYTSINCTLSLQRSTLRISPLLKDGKYEPDPSGGDNRFIDYFGATDAIVTSSGANDSGMFETNLKDERFLPFEGAGAISTWTLSLPRDVRSFDYMTISDVILHVRYTARQAGDPLGTAATNALKEMLKGQSSQALMFCLRFDFPSEWLAFVNTKGDFVATLRKGYFPYLAQSAKSVKIDGLTLYAAGSDPRSVDVGALSGDINSGDGTATLTLPGDAILLTPDASKQVFLRLQYHCDM